MFENKNPKVMAIEFTSDYFGGKTKVRRSIGGVLPSFSSKVWKQIYSTIMKIRRKKC
jgi:hypothetical protein